MTNNLPKPDDANGWNGRIEELFTAIFAPDIPKPITPETEQSNG